MTERFFVKYVPFSSCVDPSFWHKLAQLKLDVHKLEEPSQQIWGYYSNVEPRGLNRVLSVDGSSFNTEPDSAGKIYLGSILNKNTVEGFKEVDKEKFLAQEGRNLLDAIKSSALDNPQLLSRFSIISFADLKKHRFTYWFAFPALNNVNCTLNLAPYYAEELFTPEEMESIVQVGKDRSYFVLNGSKTEFAAHDLRDGFQRMKEGGDWYLVFADCSNDDEHPGWPLRNFLALFAYHCPDLAKIPVQVLCLRFRTEGEKWSAGKSLLLQVILTVDDKGWDGDNCCVGWERNEKGNIGPRLSDLNAVLNPFALAESSVDLNLKLMKWGAAPDLNLNVIKDAKCLLLGAGTLGCVVARSLLAWGVRQITFVDNSSISHSNPVRQNLYKFGDVGKPKAQSAASALKDIFPAVKSEGHQFTIPMPGHTVGESLLPETKSSFETLEQLIKSHDVIFLLMDSRESRWLPTVIAAAHNKIVINTALGFDSFLVIRHGVKSVNPALSPHNSIPGNRLGCYFCSDVTAPGNSAQGRTLDRQCTVTRPGVSNIAGSLAVELMVSILQHEAKGGAPAYTTLREENDCLLGIIPHSIRGFLSKFETILPAIEAFSSCVACSNKVLLEYKANGFNFILKVLESKKYLEELTGLTALHEDVLIDQVQELPSSEDEN